MVLTTSSNSNANKLMKLYDEAEDAYKWGEAFGIVIGGLVFAITFLILSVI